MTFTNWIQVFRGFQRLFPVINSAYPLTYIGVMVLLFLIDFLTGGGWWFYWPLLVWGIGIIAHTFTVFGIAGFLGSEWEEKKLKDLMKKMNRE